MPAEPLNPLQQALADVLCLPPAYPSTLAEQSAYVRGVAAMRHQAMALAATPPVTQPVEMPSELEAREDAIEQAENVLHDYGQFGRNPESDKLFAAIHANKHAFTAEAAHKAFAGVRRRALPSLPPLLKIASSRELGQLLDNLRQAGTLDTDPKGLLAARRDVLNFIKQLMHDYAHLSLAAREAEISAATTAKAPDPS